jgi:cell division protein FtsQ
VIRTILKLISVFILIPLTLFIVYQHLNAEGFFRLQKINIIIKSDKDSSVAYLQPWIEKLDVQLDKFKNTSIAELDLQKVYKDTSGINWIQQILITRQWPSSLKVEIVPQRIKFLYINKKGLLFPVMEDGRFLDPINPSMAPDVAVLSGDIFVERPDLRTKAIQILEEIPDKGIFSPTNISEIKYENKEGFYVQVLGDGIDNFSLHEWLVCGVDHQEKKRRG